MKIADDAANLQELRGSVRQTAGYRRLARLFDGAEFDEIDAYAASGGGSAEAVAGFGKINGSPVCAFSQNSDVAGGAMSKAQASKIRKTFQLALKAGVPVVGIYDSVGGRLDEGADMLSSFGEILLAANSLSGVVATVSLVLGPCTGTLAMMAAGADLVVMSGKAELTVATDGEGGSAEEAEKLGVCHIVEKDEEAAVRTVRAVLSMLPANNLAAAPLFDALSPDADILKASSPREIVHSVADGGSYLELGEKFGAGAVTALVRFGGTAAGAVALCGVIDADSCSKAARFVRFCDSFSLPVVTFVDAEKFATVKEASKLSSAYSEATTAKITAVTGSACGPVYIAAAGRGANADYAFAWPSATVSALAPETGAVFLWNDRLKGSEHPVEDRKKLIEEYRTTRAGALAAAAGGMIEDVVGPEQTRKKILSCLDMLSGKRISTLPKKHADMQL